jgi:hypothetical protein
MVLNIKNLFKKVCMLSAAATMAVGLGASFAEAAPGANDTGFSIDSVSIAKGNIPLNTGATNYVTLGFNTVTYNGNGQQLINSVTTNYDTTKANLWLRIADDSNGTISTDWVQYTGANSLTADALKRTNLGTYYVYGYMESNDTNYDAPTANS